MEQPQMLSPKTRKLLTATVKALGNENIRVWGFMMDDTYTAVETFANYNQWPATLHAFLQGQAKRKEPSIKIAEA